MSPPRSTRTGWAFAPGHLTGIFSPVLTGKDPRARGSVGAGLVLDAGVTASARWRPATRARLVVRSDSVRPLPISEEVATRLLARRPGRLEVQLVHELPIGQGFGMSAAGALASALAVAQATGVSQQVAVETAHLADLFGGGGLGGVSAILGGGLEIRERPGIAPRGRVRHYPTTGSVFVIVAGASIPSPSLLRDPRFLARVREAAGTGLSRLQRRPSLTNFLREAERFTDELRLGPAAVLRRVHGLRSPETKVAQAMFGRSLFAIPRTARARAKLLAHLRHSGLSSAEIPIAPEGARTLTGPPAGWPRPAPRT